MGRKPSSSVRRASSRSTPKTSLSPVRSPARLGEDTSGLRERFGKGQGGLEAPGQLGRGDELPTGHGPEAERDELRNCSRRA